MFWYYFSLFWKFELNLGWLHFGWVWQKIGFGLRWGNKLHHQLLHFIGFSLPWKFEPNPSWLSFGLILSPTLIIYWFPLILKIWAKYDLVEFLTDFGVFLSQLFAKTRITLKIWAKSELVEFLADFGGLLLPHSFAKKSDFG